MKKALELKEGQTYICTKSERSYWTEGEEYHVFLDDSGMTVLVDDDRDLWYTDALSVIGTKFKLKYSEPSYSERRSTILDIYRIIVC